MSIVSATAAMGLSRTMGCMQEDAACTEQKYGLLLCEMMTGPSFVATLWEAARILESFYRLGSTQCMWGSKGSATVR